MISGHLLLGGLSANIICGFIASVIISQDGRLDVVANDAGDRTTPSYVGLSDGEVLVGASAKQLAGRKPALSVKNNKKILSLNANDVSIKLITG